MPWLQIRIHTTPDHVPAFEDTLLDCGAMVVTFEDVHDDPVYEPDLNTTPLWKNTKVTGLFEADADIEHIRPVIEHKAESLGETDIDMKIEIVEDKDWEENGWTTTIQSNLANVFGFAQAGAKFPIQMRLR